MIVTDKLTTESFHAFIDEQLTDEQYVQVEAQLDDIPEKIEEIQQCHIINERLREVFDPVVEEPVPDDLYELGLYGLGYEEHDEENANVNDEPVSYLELEEDIAAIDSLDIFTDSDNENYIDDADADDLEFLAQTEHLSEFEIDNLRHDPSNIIPDIFDDENSDDVDFPQAYDTNENKSSADELLESIDTLSLELEKVQQNKQEKLQGDESVPETEDYADLTRNLLNELNNDSFELESEEIETSSLNESRTLKNEPEDGIQEPVQKLEKEKSEKEKIIETLTSEEVLTLEPLENQSNDAFIQELELSADEETKQYNKHQEIPVRPRNIRADQVVRDNSADIEQGKIAAEPAIAEAAEKKFTNKNSSGADDSMPEDLVAEFFSENKGADFEVNEVVKQFEEVSDNFGDVDDSYFIDEGPLGNIKYKAQQIINAMNSRITEIKTVLFDKKAEFLGKFNLGPTGTDFNKAPYTGFSSPQYPQEPTQKPTQVADTLDLSAFDDLASDPASTTLNGPFDELSPKNKFSNISNKSSVNDDFNSVELPTNILAGSESGVAEQDIFPGDFNGQPQKSNISGNKQPDNSEMPVVSNSDLNLNFGFDDDPGVNNLVNKIGDTLRHYKEKISEMRAAAAAEANEMIEGNEQATGFDKYKNIAVASIAKLRNTYSSMTLAAYGLGVCVLLGGVIVLLNGGSENAIHNQQIEKLAIDTHLLNSQFREKIVADADSAIIEKLQWFSAKIGRQVRLADIRIEDFIFKKVTVTPTMSSFAATNIFENKAGQRITLFAIAVEESNPEVPISCRIPSQVDGLCTWVTESVRYIAVANLSLSRVRSFSQQIIENI